MEDPNIEKEPTCNQCHGLDLEEWEQEENWIVDHPDQPFPGPRAPYDKDKLKRCGRCRLVYYCSPECQRSDYKDHKEDCIQVHNTRQEYIRLRDELTHAPGFFGDMQNFFETSVGHFWGSMEPRDYCRARAWYARAIHNFAHRTELYSSWQKALDHYMDLMRLSSSDNQGLRDVAPFVMIQMARYDDAYNFIKFWWVGPQHDEQVVAPSKEGDWLYLTGQNKMEDLLAIPTGGESVQSLAHVMALLLMKLRIVAHYHELKRKYECFVKDNKKGAADDTGVRLVSDQLAMAHIHDHVTAPYTEKDIKEQNQQIDKLLFRAHKDNKYMLPALINPGPMWDMGPPEYSSWGGPEEAYLVMENCVRQFGRTPHARKRILAFLASPEAERARRGARH